MQLGQKYVAFILTVFTDEYKKGINNFDDYLSAPSAAFKLTNRLVSPAPDKIIVKEKNLEFHVKQNPEFPVEYRCMFLPDNKDLIKGLLSAKGLRTMEKDVERLKAIAEHFEPLITSLESDLATANTTLEGLKAKEKDLKLQLEKPPKGEKGKLTEDLSKTRSDIQELSKKISEIKPKLNSSKAAQLKEMKSLEPAKEVKPGFFFNRKLAEQVSIANYTVALTQDKTEGSQHSNANWYAPIHENTTDNFGNMLIQGKKYIPVILSASTALEENLSQYTNSLSDFEITKSFIYHP
jgi:hypothetical protein